MKAFCIFDSLNEAVEGTNQIIPGNDSFQESHNNGELIMGN